MVWNTKIVGWGTVIVSICTFVLLWWLSDTYNWVLPGWLVGIIGFFGVGMAFRLFIMWTNREHLKVVYDLAKYQFREIKLKDKIKESEKK
jgi:hypothetical protein